jgi:hypothetical protein
MKVSIFIISVIGLFFSSYLFYSSVFAINELNDYILIAIQLILLAISVVGIILHYDCMDGILYALRIKKRDRV